MSRRSMKALEKGTCANVSGFSGLLRPRMSTTGFRQRRSASVDDQLQRRKPSIVATPSR